MGKRNSKAGTKKSKSKKHRERNSKSNGSKKEEKNPQEVKDEDIGEIPSQDNVKEDTNDIKVDSKTSNTPSDNDPETNTPADINDCCEEIKANQQELFDKLNNLSEALAAITLIRDNVNSISVDTLTELYFIRQVRPLLDALNIISFASYNMSYTATTFQNNAFADRKEIRNSLKLSYKMNHEVNDIINVVGRRLTIFINLINNMDKNCPPFDAGKDS